MVVISGNGYDHGQASGDGNLTSVSQFVDASTVRTTQWDFDWRNRQLKTTAAQDHYSITTLDNLSRATQRDQYAQATNNLIRRSAAL